MMKKIIIESDKAAVKYEATITAADDAPWDGRNVVQELRKWASSDGSGDKEKMDWAKYRRAFAWYNADKPEEFGSYKMPHHMPNSKGELVVLYRGCAAAWGSLQGARGGLNIPDADRAAVKAHIKKHYKQFGREISTEKHFNAENPKAIEIYKAINGVNFKEVDLREFARELEIKVSEFIRKEHSEWYDEYGYIGWTCQIYESSVIFFSSKFDKYYAIPWKSKKNEFVFGEPYEVKQQWVKVEGSGMAVEKSLKIEVKKIDSLWDDAV